MSFEVADHIEVSNCSPPSPAKVLGIVRSVLPIFKLSRSRDRAALTKPENVFLSLSRSNLETHRKKDVRRLQNLRPIAMHPLELSVKLRVSTLQLCGKEKCHPTAENRVSQKNSTNFVV